MPPEGRFTKPTTQNAGVSDDFNDGIIANATCVREALIEVDLISASPGSRPSAFGYAARSVRPRGKVVSVSAPSSVTTAMSSMRAPATPDR